LVGVLFLFNKNFYDFYILIIFSSNFLTKIISQNIINQCNYLFINKKNQIKPRIRNTQLRTRYIVVSRKPIVQITRKVRFDKTFRTFFINQFYFLTKNHVRGHTIRKVLKIIFIKSSNAEVNDDLTIKG